MHIIEFTDEHIANLACIRHLYQGDEAHWHLLMSHYDNRIHDLTAKYENCVEEKNAATIEAESFLSENPGKNLKTDIKRRIDAADSALADTEKELTHFTSMRQWLIDNFPDGKYRDVIGLCKAASIDEIREQDYSLNPGRYVGVGFDVEDLDDFRESMTSLKSELSALNDKSNELMSGILSNLSQLGI